MRVVGVAGRYSASACREKAFLPACPPSPACPHASSLSGWMDEWMIACLPACLLVVARIDKDTTDRRTDGGRETETYPHLTSTRVSDSLYGRCIICMRTCRQTVRRPACSFPRATRAAERERKTDRDRQTGRQAGRPMAAPFGFALTPLCVCVCLFAQLD